MDHPRTIPDSVREKMERAFGHDFSRIRVHEGGSAPSIGARAFARGESLHFAPGAFRPHTAAGQAVLGHELAHVVQQRARVVRPTTRLGGAPVNLSPGLEADADRAGAMAARGEAAAGPRPATVQEPVSAGGGVVQGIFESWDPWQIALGAAGLLGTAYAAVQHYRRPAPPPPPAPTMRIPSRTQQTYQDLRGLIGNHPRVRWNDRTRTMDTDLDGQQLIEQYPQIGWLAGGFDAPNVVGSRESLEGAFGSQALRNRRVQEHQALVARTGQAVTGFDFNAVDAQRTRTRIKREKRRLRDSPNATAGLTGVLANHPGMVFGEGHGSHENKAYIANNMATLAQSGVNTVYLEHLRPDHQQHVDNWLAAPAHQAMHPELDRFITNHDATHGANGATAGSLRGILRAAKANAVRVRAADTLAAATPADANGQGGPTRLATMNQFATEAVQGDAGRGNGKYVMLVGRDHSNTQRGNAYAQGRGITGPIPGLSQMLNIPAVTVNPLTGRPRLDKEDRGNRL